MDHNVSFDRVNRVKACSCCGVPQTFISRLRKDRCAVCALGMRVMRSDAEVTLLRQFARDLWTMRSLEPLPVEPLTSVAWRGKLETWLQTEPAIVSLEEAVRAVGADPITATAAQHARIRAILRDLGRPVGRTKYRAPPQGLSSVQAALQQLGKTEVTIEEILPPNALGHSRRRRIGLVARCLAYLGWTGGRSSVDGGKRVKLFRAPASSC